MKKFIFKALAINALVLFSACSGSDDDNNSSVELEGTWRLTAWNTATSIDLNNDGTTSTNLLDEMDCYNNERLIFSENNVVTSISTSYADIYAELDEGSETEYIYDVDCILENYTETGIYAKSGNTVTITLTDEEDESDVIIATQNGDELSLLIPDGFYVEGDDFDVVIEEDVTFVFTKQ